MQHKRGQVPRMQAGQERLPEPCCAHPRSVTSGLLGPSHDLVTEQGRTRGLSLQGFCSMWSEQPRAQELKQHLFV